MGSIQTALLGVFEVVVTIAIAAVFLGERLTWLQWLGAAVFELLQDGQKKGKTAVAMQESAYDPWGETAPTSSQGQAVWRNVKQL